MTKIRNIDEELGTPDEVPVREVILFGRTWNVRLDVNAYAITAFGVGDVKGVLAFLDNAVIDDEREAFRNAIASAKGLTAERLLAIMNALLEVASERPTTSPSDSSRGRQTKRTGQSSAVGSSGPRAVRSAPRR